VSEFYRLEIHHFFTVYKELEPGKNAHNTTWAIAAAEAEVEPSRRRLRELGHGPV
jgi:inorganic pyrophosphatase